MMVIPSQDDSTTMQRPSDAALRIVVADDHQVFADGLVQLLQSEGLQIVATTNDRDELLDLLRGQPVDVAVVDVAMPGIPIPDLVSRLDEAGIAARIVVLTGKDEPRLAENLLAAGVPGYVLKEQAFDELLLAIRTVHQGRRFVCPRIMETLWAHRGENHGLSPRQLEVLRLVAAGDTSKRIARKLGIQESTVAKHRDHIREKLGVQSAAEMIRVASERGLL